MPDMPAACLRRRVGAARLDSLVRLPALLRSALVVFGSCVALHPSECAGQSRAAENVARPAPQVRLRYDVASAPRLVTLLVTRLSAELKVGGFSPLLPPRTADGAAAASDEAEPSGGYGDIALSASGERVQLEITSQALGASSHVVLVGGEREVGALALQATEFLRAGLIPRVAPELAAQTTVETQPNAAPRPDTAPKRSGRWLLDLGPTLLVNWRAGDGLALLSLGAGYAWPGRVSLSGSIDVPLNSATFRTPAGSAEYRLWLGQLQADYAWLQWRNGEATLGLGVGMAKVTTAGKPQAPIEARQPELWSLSLGARLAAELRLSSTIALLGQARVVSLSPNPVVAILADERRLGSPSVLFALGARVGGR